MAALGGLAAIAGGVGIAAAQSHHNGGHSDAGNNSYSQGKDGVDNNGDTASPGTPTIIVSAESGDITPALSGTAEAGSTVTIRDGDSVLGTTTADSEGHWQFTVPGDKALADGSHTLTATATDAAGNTSGRSQGVAIGVDSVAPEAPALTGPALTGNETPTLNGTAEAGSTVTIRDGDSVLGTTTADADGHWNFTVPDDKVLADGSHTLTATATDAAGNTSATSGAVAIGVDSIAPEAPTITGPAATHDKTPALSGTAEAGSSVTIRDGDNVLGTTTADAGGHWQFTVPDDKSLADGSHTLTATATDAAGNTSATSGAVAIGVDSIAPEAPTITGPAATHDKTPALSGTAEAGSTVTIRDGDNVLGTTTADAGGHWQFTVPDDKALADGSHTLTATATDATGNTSATSGAVAIGVDSAAPEAPTILTHPLITGDTTPTLSGTAEAGSTVTIRDGDSVLGTTTADADGHWQFTVPDDKALADGDYTLTATATDAAGNTSSTSDGVYVGVNSVMPETPTLTGPAATHDKTPALSGTAEAGSTVTIRDGDNVLGTTTADADGHWQFTVPDDKALADGSHTLTATATDAAGNTSATSGAVAIGVDSIAPEAPTITGPAATHDKTPALSGTAEAGCTVTIRDGDSVLGTTTADADGHWNFTVPDDKALADGSHTLTATATDAAGNTSATSGAVAIGVDSAAPEAPTLTGPAATHDKTPALSGTAEAGSTVTIRDGDNVLGTTTADADGHWQFTVPDDKALADGSHTLTATATDAAGNTSGKSQGVAIGVDSVAPEAPTLTGPALTGNETPTLNGTAEAGSTVTIRDGDNVLGTTTADADGHWNFTVPDDQALADGEHTLTATATDAAGNISAGSNSATVTINPEAPLYGYDEGNVNGKGAGAVHFGTVVENVGDFSGSGGDDIAISAPFDSYGVSNDSGIVYVIRGGYSEMMSQYGNIKALLDEHPEAGVRIYNSGTGASNGQVGGVESDRMAHTITKADLNGDGKPELIIGSHINDKVYVIWGGDDISGNIDLNDIDKGLHPELGFVINSGDNGWFGYNVSAYDYNGDGIDDLLIGDISGATDERGGVFVLYGNKDKPNSDWGNIKLTATAEGPGGTWVPDEKSGLAEGEYGYIHHEDAAAGDMNYNFGTNSINLGDVNGDGFDDLLILDSYANVNGQLNGAAYLLYGSENGFNDSISVSDLSPEQIVKISNISTGAQLGNPSPDAILEGGGTTWEWQPSDKVTAALGDFYHNGDAAYDFAIASPLDSGVGKVWIIKGGATIGNNGALTVGTTAQSHMASDSGFGITGLKAENATDKIHNGAQSFGSRILGGHDIDGDGIPDLIISDPLATNSEGQSVGAVYVVYGGHIDDINKLLDSNNEVRIDQLLENNLAEVHWGSVVNGRFGSDFDVADINGDGRPDIIVGANGADGIPGGENNPDVNCGSVSVIYNKHPFPNAVPSAWAFNDEGDNHHPYVLDGDHQTIDLASLTSVLKEGHALDMSDGNSTLTVNSQQLNTLANDENGGQATLTVTGENGNVELTGGAENWHDNGTVTIDGTVYQTYQSSGQSEVQIEDRIHVTIL
ncbi:Ig-like domain-containing protein [Jejubacter calystegiae]|uniref:Ig-like domain-containing protein n=1 Tax=Jejubacter calystegiae TaxID=2579935 RepID=UPI00143CF01C|nr:Ig-like domain-containing protein [Jejubacter calystegiae]